MVLYNYFTFFFWKYGQLLTFKVICDIWYVNPIFICAGTSYTTYLYTSEPSAYSTSSSTSYASYSYVELPTFYTAAVTTTTGVDALLTK